MWHYTNTYFRIIALVMCFEFTAWYNNLLWSLVLTVRQKSKTVPVVIASIGGRTVMEWTLQMAVSLIAPVPSMIIYLIEGKICCERCLGKRGDKKFKIYIVSTVTIMVLINFEGCLFVWSDGFKAFGSGETGSRRG